MTAGLALALLTSSGIQQPDPLEGRIIDLANADRRANQLPNLDFDYEALDAARRRAQAQIGQPQLNHYDANGGIAFMRILQQMGLLPDASPLHGENLANAQPMTPAAVEQAWMSSPTHRRNILEPLFTRLAVGAAYYPDSSGATLAELFR